MLKTDARDTRNHPGLQKSPQKCYSASIEEYDLPLRNITITCSDLITAELRRLVKKNGPIRTLRDATRETTRAGINYLESMAEFNLVVIWRTLIKPMDSPAKNMDPLVLNLRAEYQPYQMSLGRGKRRLGVQLSNNVALELDTLWEYLELQRSELITIALILGLTSSRTRMLRFNRAILEKQVQEFKSWLEYRFKWLIKLGALYAGRTLT